MKNVLRSFVVLSLVFGMVLVGCDTNDDGNNGNGNGDNTPKVVAEQYRGEFHELDANGNFFGAGQNFAKLVIGETTITYSIYSVTNQVDLETEVWTVYTVGNKIYRIFNDGNESELGTFEDTNTLRRSTRTYKRPGTSQ